MVEARHGEEVGEEEGNMVHALGYRHRLVPWGQYTATAILVRSENRAVVLKEGEERTGSNDMKRSWHSFEEAGNKAERADDMAEHLYIECEDYTAAIGCDISNPRQNTYDQYLGMAAGDETGSGWVAEKGSTAQ